MKIAFRVKNSGGVMMAVEIAGQLLELPSSTVNDPLGEFGLCAIELLSGAAASQVEFLREPDGYRLELCRTEDDILEARLIWCDDLVVAGGPFETEVIAIDLVSVRDFGLNILEIYESVSRRCDPDDYRIKTDGCPFPTAIHHRLRRLLGIEAGRFESNRVPGPSETAILWQAREPGAGRSTPESPDAEQRLKSWQLCRRQIVLDSEDAVEQFLLRAIREQRTVEIIYHAVMESTRRRVRPQVLFCVEGYRGAYLEGFCEMRQAQRTFSVTRIGIPAL